MLPQRRELTPTVYEGGNNIITVHHTIQKTTKGNEEGSQ